MRTKEGNKETDILEAAIKVFAEDGYHKAKIHKIADAAGVATGSVYVYYKNKETILRKIFEDVWEKLYSETKASIDNPQMSPVEKFDSLIDILFDTFIENPSLALVFVNEQNHLLQNGTEYFTAYYEKFLSLGEEIVKEGLKSKVFNPAINVKILRSYIFGGIRNLLHQWAYDPKSFPLTLIRQNVKYLSKNGMLT
jgi:TetR/AcrR family transcriptional regulator, fatty acid metabolism regulator protein